MGNMMLRAALAAGLFVLAAHSVAVARDLTVSLQQGPGGDALRQTEVEPFVATGTPVQVVTRAPGLDQLQAGAPGWDVVQVSGETLGQACQSGPLDKLDWSKIGGRDRQLPQGATDCGLGAYATATVLSWDRGKFQGTPTWQDFWDIAKVPGKRGLQRTPRGTLEIALLADGVAPADVYRTLRTDDGVDRAFRKLEQLAPYIVWWVPGDRDAAHLLGSGEVLMTSAPSASIVQANRTGQHAFGLQWTGGLADVEFWGIVKGTPDLADAQRFLSFAGDPKRQADLPGLAGVGGMAKGANDGLSPDVAAVSPTANLGGLLFVDEGFWHDNGDKLGRRFDAFLAH
jgi:putative spermidine/putrescine transport system substrate-binding protein